MVAFTIFNAAIFFSCVAFALATAFTSTTTSFLSQRRQVSTSPLSPLLTTNRSLPTLECHSSCNLAGNCSAVLQSLLFRHCAPACEIRLTPPQAVFHLEQRNALVTPIELGALRFAGQQARLVLRYPAPLFWISNTSESGFVELANFTLDAVRPFFSLGTVLNTSVPGQRVDFGVDAQQYPFAEGWTRNVAAMHEVVMPPPPLHSAASYGNGNGNDNGTDIRGSPKVNGLDWIYLGQPPQGMPQLTVDTGASNATTAVVSLADLGFELVPGSNVIIRHTFEMTRPQLDAIVLRGVTNAVLYNVRLHSSPGMGLLAHNCTNVRLERVRVEPAPGRNGAILPLAANADALHLASCRGRITVTDCTCDRQGDDGLNVHGQYAIILTVQKATFAAKDLSDGRIGYRAGSGPGPVTITLGSHGNADNSSWGCLFSQPVFRVGDTLALRRATGLRIFAHARILSVSGSPTFTPLQLTLSMLPLGATAEVVRAGSVEADEYRLPQLLRPGDVVESLSAAPVELYVAQSQFVRTRASGMIVMASNVIVKNCSVANVSSAGISLGAYWRPFGESTFGNNVTIGPGNIVESAGLGHRTVGGGAWGTGAPIRLVGDFDTAPNASDLHRNITVIGNTISTTKSPWRPSISGGAAGADGAARGQPAVDADAVTGLTIAANNFCVPANGDEGMLRGTIELHHCASVVSQGNMCCLHPSKDAYRHCEEKLLLY